MTTQLASAFVEPISAESYYDDWLLRVSIDEPNGVLPASARWAERGPLRCFFHGLLFDREALAQSSDRDQSDSLNAALVLRAYEHGGEGALSRLRGSFVVAIIDRPRNLAIVARDPLGLHPLFYVDAGTSVLFAATPQRLFEHPGVSHALNRAALADNLCNRFPDPQETFFSAVRRVPPGWRAVVSNKRLHVERYWSPVPADRPISWLTEEEASGFDEVFNRAVNRCLGHGPTGIFLSGGLDSISVAAVATDLAQKNGQSPPLALSLGFSHPDCDERVLQARVARELGLRQHLLGFEEAVGSPTVLEQAIGLSRESSAPVMNTYHPAYRALARRGHRDGVRTILTGQGGDEWLTLSPNLAADLIRRGAFIEVARLYRTFWRSYQCQRFKLARNLFWTCGLRPLAGLTINRLAPEAHNASRLRRTLAADPSWISPDRALRSEQQDRAEGTLTPYGPAQGFYLRDVLVGLDHTISSWELEELYERGKQIGVRFLHPFWDPDMVEMLCRMPLHVLNAGGRLKGIVRQKLSRRLPTLALDRQRKGSGTAFFQSLIQREGPALFAMADDFPALSALGVIDGRAARADLRDKLKNDPNPRHLSRMFHTINQEMWVRWHLP